MRRGRHSTLDRTPQLSAASTELFREVTLPSGEQGPEVRLCRHTPYEPTLSEPHRDIQLMVIDMLAMMCSAGDDNRRMAHSQCSHDRSHSTMADDAIGPAHDVEHVVERDVFHPCRARHSDPGRRASVLNNELVATLRQRRN